MVRKYPMLCCDKAPCIIDLLGFHCSFCQMHLCSSHAEDAEVEGHIFTACTSCHATLKDRRPSKHEHCTCHDEEYCDHHDNVGSIG